MSFNYLKKYFYEKNDWLYEPEVNLLYEDVLKMPFADFEKWVAFFRELSVRVWDKTGAPPRIGVDESEMIEQFSKLQEWPNNNNKRYARCAARCARMLVSRRLTTAVTGPETTKATPSAPRCWRRSAATATRAVTR